MVVHVVVTDNLWYSRSMKTRKKSTEKFFKGALVIPVAVVTLLFPFQYAFARSAPFTVGETLDPGTAGSGTCGPLDANCYPNVSGGTTYSAGTGLSLVGSTFNLDLPSANTSGVSLLGDITGTLGASQVSSLQGNLLTITTPSSNDVLRFDGAKWVNSSLASSGATTSLNGLTGIQTFATGTSGTDFGISSTAGVHTFNIPDAGTSARGLVTTAAQTFGGIKTFNDNVIASSSLAVGTGTPLTLLTVGDSSTPNGNVVTVDDSTIGGVCTFNPGAGANWACTSDGRLKENIQSLNTDDSLAIINGLRTVSYNFIGANSSEVNKGFIAQEFQQVIPSGVVTNPDGYLAVNESSTIPFLVGAVQSLSNFSGVLKTNVTNWLADATNGIQNLYAKIIHSEEVHSNKVYTNQLCVKKSDGNDYCVTGDELEAVVSTSGIPTLTPTPLQNPSVTPDSEPAPNSDTNQTPDSSPEPTPDLVPTPDPTPSEIPAL